MDQVTPLMVTAALLLLPLVPATIIYLLLTPRHKGRPAAENAANGTMEFPLSKLKLQFNLVGSSATYLVLLVLAHAIYDKAEDQRLTILQTHVSELDANQAWLVEVPVDIKAAGATSIDSAPGELSQVQVRLDPGSSVITSHMIQFWATPTQAKFPTAWLTYPDIVKPAVIDLNDAQLVRRDYDKKTISALTPVSLEVGPHYASN